VRVECAALLWLRSDFGVGLRRNGGVLTTWAEVLIVPILGCGWWEWWRRCRSEHCSAVLRNSERMTLTCRSEVSPFSVCLPACSATIYTDPTQVQLLQVGDRSASSDLLLQSMANLRLRLLASTDGALATYTLARFLADA
jgi:hypothetical protein